MSGVNPVVLIQMMLQYHNYKDEGARTFKFIKNERMRVHTETDDEEKKRRSRLSAQTCKMAENAINKRFETVMSNRINKKLYIHPSMKKMAIPTNAPTGSIGYGMLTTGSRMPIPEGRFIRAFTYWEKVNDIDLSCFALTEDGHQREFSWRNMYANQGMDICYSGDETSGFNGGSEYFDIDIDLFKKNHHDFRYLVFCDNIYSDYGRTHFKDIFATAGFMIREKMEPDTIGHYAQHDRSIFDPRMVQTSFKLVSDSSFCYLFAIDLDTREMIWLDISREGDHAIAGEEKMGWLLDYMTITEVMNVDKLFRIMTSKDVTNSREYADLLITDEDVTLRPGQEIIHSWDVEKIYKYLQAG